MSASLSYSVDGEYLIVRVRSRKTRPTGDTTGQRKQCLRSARVRIYRIEDNKLKLCKPFEILGLYLTSPVIGLMTSSFPREIPSDSEFSTKYESTCLVGDCKYLTFRTLSVKDEANRLSRCVAPRNELFQLYQKDYNYKISYCVKNNYNCDDTLEFLFPDFSNEDTNGAAYPCIDIRGRTICPIRIPPGRTKGCFTTPGYQNLIIIKCVRNIKVRLIIEATGKSTFPPQNELILPIYTELGRVDVEVYKNIYGNSVKRIIFDEFRGLNSLVRGFYFSNPNSPCFESSGNIINPPPYAVLPFYRGLQDHVSFTITSTSIHPDTVGIPSIGLGWSGIYYGFSSKSASGGTLLLELANQISEDNYLGVNLKTSVPVTFRLEVSAILALKPQFTWETTPFAFGMCPRHFSQYQKTCGNNSVLVETEYNFNENRVRVDTKSFLFSNYIHKGFNFTFGANENITDFLVPEECTMTAKFTVIPGPPCNTSL